MAVIKKHIVYPGVEKPSTLAEIKVEICGLTNAIKIAEELISRYKQVLAIMNMRQEALQYALQEKSSGKAEEGGEGAKPEETGSSEPSSEGTEKEG